MIRTTAFEARQRQERLDAKTLDNLFRRRIEEGAKCSPFVSAAILQIVKDVFPLQPEDLGNQLNLGQIKLLVAAAHEPAGKSLEQCQKVTVLLTLDAQEDWSLRAREGVTALRRSRILRLAAEALDQGGLLSYEDLAYRLVMPNHLHWVFQPLEQWVNGLKPGKHLRTPRERIVHTIDRFTGLRCNQVLGRQGGFWQREPYDHWVRGPEELKRILLYVEGNPVKAGLAQSPHEWPHSSAWERRRRGLELGQPLTRPKPAS